MLKILAYKTGFGQLCHGKNCKTTLNPTVHYLVIDDLPYCESCALDQIKSSITLLEQVKDILTTSRHYYTRYCSKCKLNNLSWDNRSKSWLCLTIGCGFSTIDPISDLQMNRNLEAMK